MELPNLLTTIINQLQQLLLSLTNEQYCEQIPVLSNASIGQHTRHIIEFFIELDHGYETGYVNYDARKRDIKIETDKNCALSKLQQITEGLNKENKPLLLVSDFGSNNHSLHTITTNLERELMYNLEHTIHHMALIRIGVNAVSTITLPENFGVAVATMKYRNTFSNNNMYAHA
jgi:hypothetical protein